MVMGIAANLASVAKIIKPGDRFMKNTTPQKTSTPRVSLHRKTRNSMTRRKMWRQRAEDAMIKLATWPTGKPAREMHETVVLRAIGRVRYWFPDARSTKVLSALQRRVTAAYIAAQASPNEVTSPAELVLTHSGRRA